MSGDLKCGIRSAECGESRPHRKRVKGESQFRIPHSVLRNRYGFTYIAAMMLIVVMGIILSMAGRYWSTAAKREREEELLFRGDQMKKAIEMYYKWTAQKHGGKGIYPESLDELLKSKFSAAPKRFLRRIYKDPITGKADWVLVTDPSKNVIGVRSASEEEPLKTANFPLAYAAFEGKSKYSDWVFAYSPQAAGKPQQQTQQQVQPQTN